MVFVVLVCNHSKAKRGQKLNYPNGGVDIFFYMHRSGARCLGADLRISSTRIIISAPS